MTLNQAVEKAVQDELGANRVEMIKLRAIMASQGAEIARLKAEIAKLKETEPELPLAAAKHEGTTNGAHH